MASVSLYININKYQKIKKAPTDKNGRVSEQSHTALIDPMAEGVASGLAFDEAHDG